jgi:hypothetical protein
MRLGMMAWWPRAMREGLNPRRLAANPTDRADASELSAVTGAGRHVVRGKRGRGPLHAGRHVLRGKRALPGSRKCLSGYGAVETLDLTAALSSEERENCCRLSLVVRLALILTFSPWEKERPSSIVGFADDGPAHRVAPILKKDGRYSSVSSEERENCCRLSLVVRLALILTFSPWEKERPWPSGDARTLPRLSPPRRGRIGGVAGWGESGGFAGTPLSWRGPNRTSGTNRTNATGSNKTKADQSCGELIMDSQALVPPEPDPDGFVTQVVYFQCRPSVEMLDVTMNINRKGNVLTPTPLVEERENWRAVFWKIRMGLGSSLFSVEFQAMSVALPKSRREHPHPDPLLHKCVEERENWRLSFGKLGWVWALRCFQWRTKRWQWRCQNQERNLLTPTLSSTNVWRRGRIGGCLLENSDGFGLFAVFSGVPKRCLWRCQRFCQSQGD